MRPRDRRCGRTWRREPGSSRLWTIRWRPRRSGLRRCFVKAKQPFGRFRFGLVAVLALTAVAQDRDRGDRGQRSRIDVKSYLIDAQIDPVAQTITATALVRFTPLEDTSSLTFELNNALSLTKVLDEAGRQIPASRMQQDMSIRLSLPQTLQKGKLAALTFIYDGKITGNEESPVFGIKFS